MSALDRESSLQSFFVFGTAEILLPLAGVIDVAKETERLNKEKANLENVKFIAVTEYQGKRLHHHVIMSRISAEEVITQWEKTPGAGNVEIQTLYSHDTDYSNLADYLMKETRNRTGKRWTESRNLKQPTIIYTNASKQDKKALQGGKPYVPKGYTLIEENRVADDITGISCYFKYIKKARLSNSRTQNKKGKIQ